MSTKIAFAALVEIPVASVEVGDVIVFGLADSFNADFFFVWDADEVIDVDALGAHFAGGSYIAADDHPVLIARDPARGAQWAFAA